MLTCYVIIRVLDSYTKLPIDAQHVDRKSDKEMQELVSRARAAGEHIAVHLGGELQNVEIWEGKEWIR